MQPLHTNFMQHTANDVCLPIKGQRQLADRAVVLLRPRAALLHQHQLVPRSLALLASPNALPPCSLLPIVGIIGQLALARPADLHDPAVASSPGDGAMTPRRSGVGCAWSIRLVSIINRLGLLIELEAAAKLSASIMPVCPYPTLLVGLPATRWNRVPLTCQ